MTESWDRLQAVFLDALERDPRERTGYLDAACANDAGLRAEVEAMLAAHDDSAALRLESRLLDRPATSAAADRAGERVGAYRLIERIGAGGMGDVYLAERDDDAFRRRVAVKLVRQGGAGVVDQRFRRERDILARLDHPHIARLYDGGSAADGTPYIVMEYVDGEPITAWCDRHRLDLNARLRLFVQVCRAAQAAHERLVVHRDLKPSNILVAPDGTPRLLDFGIARPLEADSEIGEHTRALDRWMSPEHAAPEQIRGEPPATSTDVYALGVLLYELLTGERPLLFPTRSPAEIERIITREEPDPPSRKAASGGQAAVAEARHTDPGRLAGALRGDLDAITLMALRKEPERRYRTAGGLADDIERFLDGLPVRARPDSRRYRLGRFVRRHRLGVAAAALGAMLLVGFAAVMAWQARSVAMERDRAREGEARADRAMAALARMFEATRPGNLPGGDTLRVATFLAHGARMAGALEGAGEKAELFSILASIRRERGELHEAAALIDSALRHVPDAAARGRLLHERAVLVWMREGPGAARPLLAESLERQRRLYGPRHPAVATALQDLAVATEDPAAAERMLEESLAMRRALLAPGDPAIAAALNEIGALQMQRGAFDEARARFEEAGRILAGADASGPGRTAVDLNLAGLYLRLGDWERAERAHSRVLDARIRVYGESSLPAASAWEALGVTRANRGDLPGASDAFARALAAFETALSPSHWRVANAARNVGQLLALQGRYGDALPHLERAIAIKEAAGDLDASHAYMAGQRAMVRLGQGRRDDAIVALTGVAERLAQIPAGGNEGYLEDVQIWLGTAQLESGAPGLAEPHFRRALEMRRARLPEDHARIAEAHCGLAASLSELGRAEEASLHLRAGLAGYRAWGLGHPILRRHVEAAAQKATL